MDTPAGQVSCPVAKSMLNWSLASLPDALRTRQALQEMTRPARHALTIDSPIREYYLVGQRDTPDSAQWRTEIGSASTTLSARFLRPG
jgi:hypothetical protein